MKPLASVEQTRKEYHQFQNKKTVHRSSLLVPHMPNTTPVISFLNHFLLKRKYEDVTCKITGIDDAGKLVDSVSLNVTEPKVYSIHLAELFGRDLASYMVEFYSAQNLFIPFPAVIINHVGKDFCNIVHSYNRVLNDIFEDDSINKNHVSEASIDIVNENGAETFIMFSSGIFDIDGELEFEYSSGSKSLRSTARVNKQRLSNTLLTISQIFPGKEIPTGGVLRVTQPQQKMFYGRLLAGVMLKDDTAFSANHSYYDSSTTKEYWENDSSFRTYPYFSGFSNIIRMYPIMSPGQIEVWIEFQTKKGAVKSALQTLTSPSNDYIEINIDEIISQNGGVEPSAYTLRARAKNGKIPTRVNHQLLLGDLNSRSQLPASINVSLINENVFVPKEKTGYMWGECVTGRDYSSKLGLAFNSPEGGAEEVNVEFYSDHGLVEKMKKRLAPGEALVIDIHDINYKTSKPIDFIWYIAKSARADLSTYNFHINKTSGHTSGEHGF